MIAPGYVDIHVHGGGGYSLMTDDIEEVRSALSTAHHTRLIVCEGALDNAVGILTASGTAWTQGSSAMNAFPTSGISLPLPHFGDFSVGWIFDKVEQASIGRVYTLVVRHALATRYASHPRVRRSHEALGNRVLARRKNIYRVQERFEEALKR